MFELMNAYGREKIPFLFIIDFDMKKPVIIPLEEIDNNDILFDIRGLKNHSETHYADFSLKDFFFKKHPMPFEKYLRAFNFVTDNQRDGNSYLVNLTFPTEIETNLSLKDIFFNSTAKYKLLYKDEFVVFSPESFVIIEGNRISSFPMKGTIDASVPDAERIIVQDEKEFSEHVTIVDLIRNDLNMVATDIKLEKFQYIDRIKTSDKELLQVSSHITGTLAKDFHARIGDIMRTLLPAGSISGAPKKKTVEIIKQAEQYDRGYYTGIFGYFDGSRLDSAVMIRFIEKNGDRLFYKSGGGITVYSDPESEYRELIDKVYVPIT